MSDYISRHFCIFLQLKVSYFFFSVALILGRFTYSQLLRRMETLAPSFLFKAEKETQKGFFPPPKCYRHFRFRSWYVPAIQVQTLNGLHIDRFCWYKWFNKENRRRYWVNLCLGKTVVKCPVGRSFAAACFCVKHEMLLSWGRGSFSGATYMFV